MEVLFRDFQHANDLLSGPLLAATISPVSPPHYLNRIETIWKSTNHAAAERDIGYGLTKSYTRPIKYPSPEVNLWTEIYLAYWNAVDELLAVQDDDHGRSDGWIKVYTAWKKLANTVIQGYSSNVLEAWTLPVLYMAGRYLRIFAIKADETAKKTDSGVDVDMGGMQDDIAGDYGKNMQLEDAARVINRMFTLCISDRAPLDESRKWGLYYTTNLLFKTYFKLNSVSLSKNILRALSASRTDMPDLDAFPKSHIVTFKYYVGVIHFLEEDYQNAQTNLTQAFCLCRRTSKANLERILTYLIPTHLLTTRSLPSQALLQPYPRLSALFTPLIRAIRLGCLSAFDTALAAGESTFVRRRIYLTLERGRDLCLRNLLRQVFLNAGFEGDTEVRRSRIKLAEFATAMRYSLGAGGEDMEDDEVECLMANIIYRGLMKGYISRAASTVVLAKNGAFPGTGI